MGGQGAITGEGLWPAFEPRGNWQFPFEDALPTCVIFPVGEGYGDPLGALKGECPPGTSPGRGVDLPSVGWECKTTKWCQSEHMCPCVAGIVTHAERVAVSVGQQLCMQVGAASWGCWNGEG